MNFMESFEGIGDYFFTYGGALTFFIFSTLVLLPLLYHWFIKPLVQSAGGRLLATLVVWAALFAVAYGDVIQIARDARQLCKKESGLHVYSTAETDGIYGTVSREKWFKYGFSFAEFRGSRYWRVTLKDGKEVREPIAAPTSRYEFALESTKVSNSIRRDSNLVRDRQTGEILGEQVSFSIYPGWADRKLLGFLGFTWSPPFCANGYAAPGTSRYPEMDELIRRTLKPKKASGEQP